ncbi:MAG: hypothetical protein ACT4O5_10515 [Gammaproteobacteria bacterium]
MISGRVRNGRVELDGASLPEGTSVTIIAADDDGTFELSPEEEAELDAALAEVSRGEVVDASEVLEQIRSR